MQEGCNLNLMAAAFSVNSDDVNFERLRWHQPFKSMSERKESLKEKKKEKKL